MVPGEDQKNIETVDLSKPEPAAEIMERIPKGKAAQIVDKAIEEKLATEKEYSLERQLEFRELNEIIDAGREEMRRLVPFELKKELPLPSRQVEVNSQNEPTIIGKYVLKRKLGKGAFGDVYEARDYHLGKRMVIKIMNPMALKKQEYIENFFHEIQITANVRSELLANRNNAHTVFVSDAGKFVHPRTGQETFFYVMEECDGGDLLYSKDNISHLSKKEKLDLVEKNVLGLIEALEHMHEHKLVHSDIKPQNILIDRGQWKLSDFGMAKTMQEIMNNQGKGAIIGTPKYWAPEYVAGEVRNREMDFYSLAVTLFEVFTNTDFFPKDMDTGQVVRNLVLMFTDQRFSPERAKAIKLRLKAGFTPRVARIMYRMMQPDPNKRIQPQKLLSRLKAAIAADKEELRMQTRETGPFKIPVLTASENQ